MASGDISKKLLAEVRTFADEVSAAFWTDDEIYQALTDAQREYASKVLTIYKGKIQINPSESMPEVLRVLIGTSGTTLADGISVFTAPTDFLYDIALKYNHLDTLNLKPCFKREIDGNYYFKQANSLLQADTTKEYYYLIIGNSFILETPVNHAGGGGYFLTYLKTTTDITTSIDPILPPFAFPAFVQYAFGDILNKDSRVQESMGYYSKFQSMVEYK